MWDYSQLTSSPSVKASAEEKKQEKAEAKVLRDRIKRARKRSEERMREENLRALTKQEAATREAEWRK